MSAKDWGGPRLATHALVLGTALVGLALGPLGWHPGSSEAVAASATHRQLLATPLEPPTPRAPASVRPGSAALREMRVAPQPADAPVTSVPVATTANLNENLHHLARFVWPAQGAITTYFWPYHPGIDIANVVGTPEMAADAGQVVFAGWGEYGLYVEIDHGNGFHTIYGHMSSALVRAGEAVNPGQQIGLMGSTGRSTGSHVHFEIRFQGEAQNPLDFLR